VTADGSGGPVTRVLVVDDEPQILRGLGTNLRARGYEVDTAPDGEQALELAARRRPDVVILDLGLPGIAENELETVFEAFHSSPTDLDHRGSGLGLTIARGFAAANGGRIWAESRPGQGATFVLALPIAVVSAAAPA